MICYHQVFLIVTSAICMTRSSDECSHGQWMCQDKSCILREKVNSFRVLKGIYDDEY